MPHLWHHIQAPLSYITVFSSRETSQKKQHVKDFIMSDIGVINIDFFKIHWIQHEVKYVNMGAVTYAEIYYCEGKGSCGHSAVEVFKSCCWITNNSPMLNSVLEEPHTHVNSLISWIWIRAWICWLPWTLKPSVTHTRSASAERKWKVMMRSWTCTRSGKWGENEDSL